MNVEASVQDRLGDESEAGKTVTFLFNLFTYYFIVEDLLMDIFVFKKLSSDKVVIRLKLCSVDTQLY